MTTPNTPTVSELLAQFQASEAPPHFTNAERDLFHIQRAPYFIALKSLHQAFKILNHMAKCEVPTRRTELIFQKKAQALLREWGFE